jgi:hypothetical protein
MGLYGLEKKLVNSLENGYSRFIIFTRELVAKGILFTLLFLFFFLLE